VAGRHAFPRWVCESHLSRENTQVELDVLPWRHAMRLRPRITQIPVQVLSTVYDYSDFTITDMVGEIPTTCSISISA